MSGARGNWRELQARLSEADFETARLLVGLDFDGTLADIAATPSQAVLAPDTRRLLEALAARPDTKVAVLSGRALAEVRAKVGLPGLYYGGNHGLELEGPRLRWSHPLSQGIEPDLLRSLKAELQGVPGALLEPKRLGVAVHYRQVPPSRARRLRRRLRARLAPFKERVRVLDGKKTVDVRSAVPWGKGHALEFVRRALPGGFGWTAMFVGDDATDEEAFAMIGPKALTIRVGRVRSTAAQFVLPRRGLVDRLLELLACRGVID